MSEIDNCENGFYCIEPCSELQQLKQENEELKKLKDEILNKKPSEREYCKGCTLPAYSKVLDEIEDRIQDLDNYSENNMVIMNDILQKIKQVKECE